MIVPGIAASQTIAPATANSSTAVPPAAANPSPPQIMPEVDVTERSDNLVGIADSATPGTIGRKELTNKPLQRTGSIVETVPGVIVTQHSGGGKANQYFFRGFNLDHGTDVAFYVDGIPVNMPTHAHGPGYSDLNFVIPELVSTIDYRKGSYSAEQGDFSSAGTIKLNYADTVPGIIEGTYGSFGDERALLIDTAPFQKGTLLYAADLNHYDGPWVHPDDYHRANGVIKYSYGTDQHGWDATAMAYDGVWNATDQVPEDSIDDGSLNRYSLSAESHHQDSTGTTEASIYAIKYHLDLFSDFTYYLYNPTLGDQIEQYDDRAVYGGQITRTVNSLLAGHVMTDEYGGQLRFDDIYNIDLFNTVDRVRWSTMSDDSVKQLSYAPFIENRIQWSNYFRTIAALRWDFYNFDVNANIAANSGNVSANIPSPKLTMIFGPWRQTEYYLNLGQGFHSNDARAITLTSQPEESNGVITFQPTTGDKPLTKSNEAEIGVRSAAIANLQSTLSLWYLHLDSELVFDPDLGSSVAGPPSQRLGVEYTNYYTPTKSLTIDADFAYSYARFTGDQVGGDYIPGSPQWVIGSGIAYNPETRISASLRVRYIGTEPLTQDDTVRSNVSTVLDSQVGYAMGHGYKLAGQIFNLLNASVWDIQYYYTYRLPGQPAAGVNGIDGKPGEPRSFRIVLSKAI
jgi:hypothetical protein